MGLSRQFLKTIAFAFVLIAAAVIVRANAFHYGFVYDDPFFLFHQDAVKENAGPAVWFGGTVHGLYRPVRSAVYAGLTKLFSDAPLGYRILAVTLDAATAVMLFFALSLVFTSPAAFAGALLWLVHPAHSERVVLISGSFDIWGLVFMMSALWLALKISLAEYKPTLTAWIGLAAFSLLAVFSNEEAVLLPGYFLAITTAGKGIGRFAGDRKDRAAFIVILAAVTLYLFIRISLIGLVERAETRPLESGGSVLPVILAVMWWFISKTFVPTELHETYPPFTYQNFGHGNVIAGAAVLLVLLLAALYGLHKRRWLSAASSWWLIAILPFSNIIPNVEQRHVRYLYVPTMALAVAAAWAYGALKQSLHVNRLLVAALFASLSLTYGGMTLRQNRVYADSLSLWGDSYRECPRCSKAAINYGIALAKAGRPAEARDVLRTMLLPKLGYEMAFVALAAVELDAGHRPLAESLLDEALSIAPRNEQARAMKISLGINTESAP